MSERTDSERLDWLEAQSVAFVADHPEFGWKAYPSRTERGYRLSTTRQEPHHDTVRQAIDAAMDAETCAHNWLTFGPGGPLQTVVTVCGTCGHLAP